MFLVCVFVFIFSTCAQISSHQLRVWCSLISIHRAGGIFIGSSRGYLQSSATSRMTTPAISSGIRHQLQSICWLEVSQLIHSNTALPSVSIEKRTQYLKALSSNLILGRIQKHRTQLLKYCCQRVMLL